MKCEKGVACALAFIAFFHLAPSINPSSFLLPVPKNLLRSNPLLAQQPKIHPTHARFYVLKRRPGPLLRLGRPRRGRRLPRRLATPRLIGPRRGGETIWIQRLRRRGRSLPLFPLSLLRHRLSIIGVRLLIERAVAPAQAPLSKMRRLLRGGWLGRGGRRRQKVSTARGERGGGANEATTEAGGWRSGGGGGDWGAESAADADAADAIGRRGVALYCVWWVGVQVGKSNVPRERMGVYTHNAPSAGARRRPCSRRCRSPRHMGRATSRPGSVAAAAGTVVADVGAASWGTGASPAVVVAAAGCGGGQSQRPCPHWS